MTTAPDSGHVGEDHPLARLTEADVRELRRAYAVFVSASTSSSAIAKSPATITEDLVHDATDQALLEGLASLVGDIRALRPLQVSAEMRLLAQKAALERNRDINDDQRLHEWARQLADSVSDAND